MQTILIKEAFVKAVNAFITEKDELIANTKVMMCTLCDTTELEVEQDRRHRLRRIPETPQRTGYLVRNRKGQIRKGVRGISDKQGERKVYMRFISGLKRLDGLCKGFDDEL